MVSHLFSKKHQTKCKACKISNVVNKYFVVQNSFKEELIVGAEITKIYHTIRHNQSYNSLDCSFKLNKLIFEDSKLAGKASCGSKNMWSYRSKCFSPKVVILCVSKN